MVAARTQRPLTFGQADDSPCARALVHIEIWSLRGAHVTCGPCDPPSNRELRDGQDHQLVPECQSHR
jgi:hypothetical protein